MFDLGTNTSFNVVTICQQNNIDYKTLTTGNFLVESGSVNGSMAKYISDNTIPTCSSSISKSYNSSTGVLTCSMYLSMSFYSGSQQTKTASGNVHAYLVY